MDESKKSYWPVFEELDFRCQKGPFFPHFAPHLPPGVKLKILKKRLEVFTQGRLLPSFKEIGQAITEKMEFTDGRTDGPTDGRVAMTIGPFGLTADGPKNGKKFKMFQFFFNCPFPGP